MRQATTKDIDKIIDLRKLASQASLSHYDQKTLQAMTDAGDKNYYNKCIDDPDVVVIVEECDNKIVGFGCLGLKPGRIKDLFILPNYQGKRIGSKILDYFEKLLLKKGKNKIVAWARLSSV